VWRHCWTIHTWSPSTGTIAAPGGFSITAYNPGLPSGSSVSSSRTRIQWFS
jgi:hypothetical protein